jgi:glycerophosphoryl diester phosphodiesterase
VQVIGHRGAAALAPENTWAGFDLALDLGVDAIETDVRATSDGVLVLLHDERLDRTTDGTGIVHGTPWDVVGALDAGAWFRKEFTGARVPRLYETLARYGHRTRLVLEIKQDGIEGRVLDMVLGLDLISSVTLTSFSFETACRCKLACAEATVGFLSPEVGPDVIGRVLDAGLDQFCPPAHALSREQVRTWKAQGLAVRAWGIRNVDLMAQAIEAGVDGMTVDFPHLLLQALGRSGRST